MLVFKEVEIWIIYRLRRRRDKKMMVKTETGRIMKSGSRDGMDRRNMGGKARLEQSLEK